MELAKKSPLRRLVLLLGGALVIALVVIGVRHFSSGQVGGANGATTAANAVVPVTATTATRQDVPNLISTIGTVQSIDSVAIQPRVTGAIQKIEFTPGQNVKQGQERSSSTRAPFRRHSTRQRRNWRTTREYSPRRKRI